MLLKARHFVIPKKIKGLAGQFIRNKTFPHNTGHLTNFLTLCITIEYRQHTIYTQRYYPQKFPSAYSILDNKFSFTINSRTLMVTYNNEILENYQFTHNI